MVFLLIFKLMTELSDLYYKESNTNAGNSYRKVAEAVRTLEFEITASNAKVRSEKLNCFQSSAAIR